MSTNNTPQDPAMKQNQVANAPEKKPAPTDAPKVASNAEPVKTERPLTGAAKAAYEARVAREASEAREAEMSRLTVLKTSALVNLMVTLDMTGGSLLDQTLMESAGKALERQLESVSSADGKTHNLWSPFSALTSKIKLKHPNRARGLVRNVMSALMGQTTAVEPQTLVGRPNDVADIIEQLCRDTVERVRSSIGINGSDEVAAITDRTVPVVDGAADADSLTYVTFDDLISVNGWSELSGDVTDPNDQLISNITINVRVRAGALFASPDLHLAIPKAFDAIRREVSATDDTATVFVGVLMDADAVADSRFIDLYATINDALIFSRRTISEGRMLAKPCVLPVSEEGLRHLFGDGEVFALLDALVTEDDEAAAETGE